MTDIAPPTPAASADLYAKSYLVIRIAVGLLGFALPTMLWVGETWLDRSVRFRGSLSSYYHSAMQDVFVGTLWAIGVLLVAYRAWTPRSRGFLLSLGAGLGAILLAFFPTARPGDPPNSCGPDIDPQPPDCEALQIALGEDTSQRLHFAATALFLTCAALLCLYLAIRARRESPPHQPTVIVQGACFAAMVIAVLWIFFGPDLGSGKHTFKPLYVGELLAVYAFAVSWLTEVRLLWRLLRGVAPAKDLGRALAA